MDQIGVQLGRVVERERCARRARALQRRPRGLRLRRLARPGRAAALGGGVRRAARAPVRRPPRRPRARVHRLRGRRRRAHAAHDRRPAALRARRHDRPAPRARRRSASSWPARCATSAPRWPSAARPSRSASCRRCAADAGQLQRVFLNLLGNAIKFTAPGVAPQVTVSGRSAGDGAEIAVADNGIGIDPARGRARLRDVRRAFPGRRRSTRAPASGLAISRRIVERHGGRLWVEPNAGGGSVFALRLPLP